MANIKTIDNQDSNSVRAMIYKNATRGMDERDQLAYSGLLKALEKKEPWAIKLHYDIQIKMFDKKIMNSVDLSAIDFSKYKEAKDIPELCIALSQAVLVNKDNLVSLNDIKDMINILTNLKVASEPKNFAVDLSDQQLQNIYDIVNTNEYKNVIKTFE